MERSLEGTHSGFLRHIMGNQARRKADRTWVTPKSEVLWEAAVTQLEITYIRRRQGAVAQWVALRPIFEVCTRRAGYSGGERRRDAWWRQEAVETHIRETLEEISWEARRSRRGYSNMQ